MPAVVTIEVPTTSANLGSGYDCLRAALQKIGHQGRAIITRVDNRGACVIV